MWATTFPNRAGRTKFETNGPWQSVVALVRDPPEYPDKDSCPWISLCRYGDTRTEAGSLKHAGNIICVSGIEGDHDAGEVSIEDAAERARSAGLRAVFYTSPSHKPEAPRWRVLAPLARDVPIEARAGLLDRLNGVMGGALADESWAMAQGFIYGRVVGVEYQCLSV
jgi:hypothetical protein